MTKLVDVFCAAVAFVILGSACANPVILKQRIFYPIKKIIKLAIFRLHVRWRLWTHLKTRFDTRVLTFTKYEK